MQHIAYNMKHTVYNIQNTSNNIQHMTYNKQYKMCTTFIYSNTIIYKNIQYTINVIQYLNDAYTN